MYRVRPIEPEEAAFAFGLDEGTGQVGRVEFVIEPSVPDDAWLGDLPPMEMFVRGLELPWESDWLAAGTELLRAALAQLPQTTPATLQANTNLEHHNHPWSRLHLFEALGFELFQEKHGYLWVDRGEPFDGRLEYRTLADAGDAEYKAVLAGVPASGLDRNDNYYYRATGSENWASVMMTLLEADDRESCLIGYAAGDSAQAQTSQQVPVGVVALSEFDEPDTGTITYIGVLPEHRGRGFGRQLLTAATAAARQRGFKQILSDVDVLNIPMRTAMASCGHQPDLRPWHRWSHWLQIR